MADESQANELNAITDEEVKEQMVLKKWANRRFLAKASFWSMILMTIALFFFVPESRLDKISDAVTWAYITFSSITLAYVGATTWDGKK